MGHKFVLVHGGFHGGWCWKYVAQILRAAGHDVTTPTMTGLGEKHHLVDQVTGPETFARDLVNHLVFEDIRDAVLVGHSFAGLALAASADQVPDRIRQLIFLDALLVGDGECALDTVPVGVAAGV